MQIEINKEEEKEEEEEEEEEGIPREKYKSYFSFFWSKRKSRVIHNTFVSLREKCEENIFERVNSLPILEQPGCPRVATMRG